MKFLKIALVFGIIFLLPACTWTQKDKSLGFSVKGVMFLNSSGYDISELKLTVHRTGGIVACGYIPSGGECSTTFPAKDYKGGELSLNWNESVNGELKTFTVEHFLMPMPERKAKDMDYKAIFHLGSEGLLDSNFI